jgi:hypothetical protein
MSVKSFISKNKFLFYVLRWMVFAIPGAILMDFALKLGLGLYLTMILTQGILGAFIFNIDKRIFR